MFFREDGFFGVMVSSCFYVFGWYSLGFRIFDHGFIVDSQCIHSASGLF